MKHVQYLRVQFQPEITPAELPKFRGAVIQAVEREHLLFHNHLDEERLRYAYPLIQYKRLRGKPALVCLDEGTDAIHALFERRVRTLHLGTREIELQVEAIDLKEWTFEVSPRFFPQRIRNWLALSPDNYPRYRQLESRAAQHAFLAHVLRGNLLAMAKGLGWYIEQEVLVALHDVSTPRPARYKDTTLMAFDASFSCNIALPPNIGLGKGAAKGFGVVESLMKNRNPKYEEM